MMKGKGAGRTGKKQALAVLCLISLMLTAPAVQAEKVVVIPLGGTTNIGASIFWTGAWRGDENFQYAIGDGMQYDGSSYICVKDHESSPALIPSDDPDHWSLMAAKGATGDAGPTIADKVCPEGESVIGFESNIPLCTGDYTYPQRPLIIFVSSMTYTGDLGGLAGADAKCQALADSASLPGSYKAWLSDSSTSAGERVFPSDAGYVDTRGNLITPNLSSLLTVGPLRGIIRNENGMDEGGNAWTGTNEWGFLEPFNNDFCKNWTSADYLEFALTGIVFGTRYAWTDMRFSPCEEKLHIYCFQQ